MNIRLRIDQGNRALVNKVQAPVEKALIDEITAMEWFASQPKIDHDIGTATWRNVVLATANELW